MAIVFNNKRFGRRRKILFVRTRILAIDLDGVRFCVCAETCLVRICMLAIDFDGERLCSFVKNI